MGLGPGPGPLAMDRNLFQKRVFEDIGMFKFSNLVCLRILGCLNFGKLHVQESWDVLIFKFCVLRILGCLNFQNLSF